jgi:hypothetical protein
MLVNSNEFPLSVRNLRKFTGKGPRYEFMAMLATRDYSVMVHDFNRSITADVTNTWTVAAGATATTWAAVAGAGGWVRGVSGTTAATSGLQMFGPTSYWTGTSVAGFAIIWRPSVITETRFEMGFVNAMPAVNTSIVNSLVTPTFNTAATAALYVFDHTGSTTTSGLYTKGSGAAADKQVLTTGLPVAATPHFAAVEVNGANVTCWAGTGNAMVRATKAGGVTAADALVPAFSHKKSDTTTSNVDVDCIITWSGRLG